MTLLARPARRLALLVTATVVAAAACGRGTADTAAPTASNAPAVSVAVVRADALRDVLNLPGTVVPSTAGELLVVPPGPALISELPKKEGDAVAVGDVLARFDVTSLVEELNARRLDHTEASSRLARAKDALAKQTAMSEKGLTPRNQLEAAKVDVSSAEFALSQATMQLQSATAHQDNAVIRARASGVVAKVLHTEGEFVSGSVADPVLRVIDPTKVQVIVQVPTSQLGRVLQGQTASVQLLTSAAPEPATVVVRPASADPNAPTVDVRLNFVAATLTTPPALDSPVSVEILVDQRSNVLVIPTVAVQKDEGGTFVLLAGDDGRAHRRDIRVGLIVRELAQVVSGLEIGEKVILTGFDELSENALIQIIK